MASKSGSVSSGVNSGVTLSRSDRDATLDGARLAIAGVKDVMIVVANARVGSKSGGAINGLDGIAMCVKNVLRVLSRHLAMHLAPSLKYNNASKPSLDGMWLGRTNSTFISISIWHKAGQSPVRRRSNQPSRASPNDTAPH